MSFLKVVSPILEAALQALGFFKLEFSNEFVVDGDKVYQKVYCRLRDTFFTPEIPWAMMQKLDLSAISSALVTALSDYCTESKLEELGISYDVTNMVGSLIYTVGVFYYVVTIPVVYE